jgi:hypothetical protein
MQLRWFSSVVVMALATAAEAGHSTVVVMSDPAQVGELGAALQVALAGRGYAIASSAQPSGPLRLDRAAAAQRAAVELDADAALWIDHEPGSTEVCAVSADGRVFRHVPISGDAGDSSPRMFAAVATSLIDELVSPPESATVGVDVHVDIEATAPPGIEVPRAPSALPPLGVAPANTVISAATMPVRAHRTLMEVGAMVSPYSAGLEAEIAWPLSPAYRVGVMAGGELLLANSHKVPVYNGAVELRRVSEGTHHFDLGFLGGFAYTQEQLSDFTREHKIVYGGLRLSYTWEAGSSGISVSLVPLVGSDGKDTVPVAYGAVRWELPL